MPKSKPPRKAHKPAPVDDDELQVQQLSLLALSIVEDEVLAFGDDEDELDDDVPDIAVREEQLSRLIRNALRKKKDAVLYGALDAALGEDPDAYLMLRSAVEEAASTYTMQTKEGVALEITAFAIPFFVHSDGGLDIAHDFGDDAAFSQLVDSFTSAGLESASAKVVMLSHAYDLHEIDRITFSELQDMVREAASAMTGKKLVERPALQASISGWAQSAYEPDDKAVELRFLVGFSLREEQDPFYLVPDDEEAADAYFDARMERYRGWTEQAGPLVKRCLAADPAAIELFFLHQDMFYDAKAQALAEVDVLGVISSITEAIEDEGIDPQHVAEQVSAVIGLLEVDETGQDEPAIRINLYDAAGKLFASPEKPLALTYDPVDEVDQLIDALKMLKVEKVQICDSFDADGKPVGLQSAS